MDSNDRGHDSVELIGQRYRALRGCPTITLRREMCATTQAAYNSFVMIPPDFLWGSTAASSLGGGITRGTYERVAVAGFAGDGNMYLGAGGRGQNGTTAIAWPAGALVELVGSGISLFKVTNSHVNAQDAFSVMGAAGANLTRNCDNSGREYLRRDHRRLRSRWPVGAATR